MHKSFQNLHFNIKRKWLQYLQMMDRYRVTNQALQYNVERMDKKEVHKKVLKYKTNVAITCTEIGHKQTINTSIKI